MELGRDQEKRRKAHKQWVAAGNALVIPFLLLAGPIVGYLLGRALDGWLGNESPVFTTAGVILGAAAGIMETVNLIRRISRE